MYATRYTERIVVLIVPFMELKLASDAGDVCIEVVLIVPFMELKLP